MSKKSLLNESQIRQFMKLAHLEPLTPGFVNGLTEASEDEGELDESHGRGRGEGPAGYGDPADAGRAGDRLREEEELDDMEGEGDMDMDAEAEVAEEPVEEPAEESAGRMISVDDFLSALESALETAMGEEVEIDADEVEAEEEPMGDEEPMDAEEPMDDEMALEEAADTDEEVTTEAVDEEVTTEAVVEEGDEEELEEGAFGLGKDYEKMAKGKKGSYAPDPEEGEEEWKGSAPGGKTRTGTTGSRLGVGRRSSSGGMKVPGITAEGQDELVEQITKKVAARILKSALAKK